MNGALPRSGGFSFEAQQVLGHLAGVGWSLACWLFQLWGSDPGSGGVFETGKGGSVGGGGLEGAVLPHL